MGPHESGQHPAAATHRLSHEPQVPQRVPHRRRRDGTVCDAVQPLRLTDDHPRAWQCRLTVVELPFGHGAPQVVQRCLAPDLGDAPVWMLRCEVVGALDCQCALEFAVKHRYSRVKAAHNMRKEAGGTPLDKVQGAGGWVGPEDVLERELGYVDQVCVQIQLSLFDRHQRIDPADVIPFVSLDYTQRTQQLSLVAKKGGHGVLHGQDAGAE